MKIKPRDLLDIGFKEGPCIGEAIRCIARAAGHGMIKSEAVGHLTAMLEDYAPYLNHEYLGPLAQLMDSIARPPYVFKNYNEVQEHYKVWGRENIEQGAIDQMDRAVSIPPAVLGAIMPDGHQGYGLPIGGVLALDNAVMPWGVGNDIACQVMLSVTPVEIFNLNCTDHKSEVNFIEYREDSIIKAIEKHTRFGLNAQFTRRRNHDVMDMDWSIIDGIYDKDKAWNQLGSSGGGNHFVDFGEIEFTEDFESVPAGKYIAILTHSGSRGLGSKIANHFTKIAMAKHPLLPAEYKRLAWLSLDDEDGQAYWKAMELAGAYASANHHCMHESLLKELGLLPMLQVGNLHNFAWKETHGGKEVIVHRKGATPAGEGVMGIIPGTMADPAFLVKGKGSADSLNSAAHGAGRAMSRTAAKEKYRWASVKEELKEKKVKLIGAGLDEVPGAYKNILEVMAAQSDLVEIVAKFQPRLVKMAGDGYVEE